MLGDSGSRRGSAVSLVSDLGSLCSLHSASGSLDHSASSSLHKQYLGMLKCLFPSRIIFLITVLSYIGNKLMRATRHSLALLSSVLLFDIVELWFSTPILEVTTGDGNDPAQVAEYQPATPTAVRRSDKHEYHCTFVYVMEEFHQQNPDIIAGYYPEHKREHLRSPLVSILSASVCSRSATALFVNKGSVSAILKCIFILIMRAV
jgi:hypothetical protein